MGALLVLKSRSKQGWFLQEALRENPFLFRLLEASRTSWLVTTSLHCLLCHHITFSLTSCPLFS